ncbi:Lrp/AsnC family transcriptional regulator [Chloroflexota bacterium]
MINEVLKILEEDARTTTDRIATMTGTKSDVVVNLIKEAEGNRTILKYKTLIDWEKTGVEQVWALIEVKVTPEPDTGFDAVAERIAYLPQVRSVFLASGNYDLLLVVIEKTEREVSDFVSRKLSHIEGVQGTVTHFVLKRYKQDGEILDRGTDEKRQPVML